MGWDGEIRTFRCWALASSDYLNKITTCTLRCSVGWLAGRGGFICVVIARDRVCIRVVGASQAIEDSTLIFSGSFSTFRFCRLNGRRGWQQSRWTRDILWGIACSTFEIRLMARRWRVSWGERWWRLMIMTWWVWAIRLMIISFRWVTRDVIILSAVVFRAIRGRLVVVGVRWFARIFLSMGQRRRRFRFVLTLASVGLLRLVRWDLFGRRRRTETFAIGWMVVTIVGRSESENWVKENRERTWLYRGRRSECLVRLWVGLRLRSRSWSSEDCSFITIDGIVLEQNTSSSKPFDPWQHTHYSFERCQVSVDGCFSTVLSGGRVILVDCPVHRRRPQRMDRTFRSLDVLPSMTIRFAQECHSVSRVPESTSARRERERDRRQCCSNRASHNRSGLLKTRLVSTFNKSAEKIVVVYYCVMKQKNQRESMTDTQTRIKTATETYTQQGRSRINYNKDVARK